MTTLNVFAIGCSKNIGYFTSIRLLDAGANITFLLRSTSVFDKDEKIQGYIKSGKAHLVKGDGLVQSEVQNGWTEAAKHGDVDLLLFTVGGAPSFHPTKGFIITPMDLVTRCLLNALCTVPKPYPKIVTISSTGLTKSSHDKLPFLLKPLYGHFLDLPHKDKVGAERLIHHCAGWKWNTEDDGEPIEAILPSGWMDTPGLPEPGSLHEVIVIRPAFLTDGDCEADKVKDGKKAKKGKELGYRVDNTEIGGWTISRKDVAHFIAGAVLNDWDAYRNKCMRIAY